MKGLEDSPFEWNVHFADVQTLNESIMAGKLDVAKVSAQVYPKIEKEYVCLGCGGAIGYGCGPLLLSSGSGAFDENSSTVLPGADTTAALLFKFWYQRKFGAKPDLQYALFNEVYEGLTSKKYVQGVTIHEHRFTWKRDGLYLLQDLGAFWEQETGTPIPLGISVARRTLGEDIVAKIEAQIRSSLRIARSRANPITPFIDEKAQIEDKKVMEAHIKMFVNDFSEDVGERGWASLENLWALSNCE